MTELRDILAAAIGMNAGESALLATLVKAEGSSYRRAGVRMLILPDGRRIGTISAGCIENDIHDKGWERTQSGPAVLVFNMLPEADAVVGYGAGCPGRIHVLLERIEGGRELAHLRFVVDCMDGNEAGVLATVHGAQAPAGLRLMLQKDQTAREGDWPDQLAQDIHRQAQAVLAGGRSANQVVGCAEVFFEIVRPIPQVVIFGANDNSLPLVRISRQMGWRVIVADRRENLATPEHFPLANRVFACSWKRAAEQIGLDGRTFAVVLSHNYLDDLELLSLLLPSPACYVGLMGARKRTRRLMDDLAKQSLQLTAQQQSRLHAPIGLDIGAETDEQLALSIVAEIQAVYAGRTGGMLRSSNGLIHADASCAGER